jgi:hypothetical protein
MIKFLIELFLIFLFIRLVAPFLLRWLLGLFVKKAVKNGGFYTNMRPEQRQQQNYQQQQPTGKIKIDYIPEDKANPKKDFTGGEYVDYEEVK